MIRTAVFCVAPISLASTAFVSLAAQEMDQPPFQVPARPWVDVDGPSREVECRDRIDHARAAAGKPKLERQPANEEKPDLLYAVDRRVDGCSVLVPVSDPASVRPAPQPGKPELRKIEPSK